MCSVQHEANAAGRGERGRSTTTFPRAVFSDRCAWGIAVTAVGGQEFLAAELFLCQYLVEAPCIPFIAITLKFLSPF